MLLVLHVQSRAIKRKTNQHSTDGIHTNAGFKCGEVLRVDAVVMRRLPDGCTTGYNYKSAAMGAQNSAWDGTLANVHKVLGPQWRCVHNACGRWGSELTI